MLMQPKAGRYSFEEGEQSRALQPGKGNPKGKRGGPLFAMDLQDFVAKWDGEGDDDK